MALDTTVAGANALSYVSLEEVRQNLYGPALHAWDALPTVEEQEAVVRAVMDDIECQLYSGTRYSSTQSLRFPFSAHFDNVNNVKTPYIHPRVKKACYFQIEDRMLNGRLNDAYGYRDRGITSLSLPGGVKSTFANKNVTIRSLLCVKARSILAPFCLVGSIAVRR